MADKNASEEFQRRPNPKLNILQTTVNIMKMIFGFGSFVLNKHFFEAGWTLSALMFVFTTIMMVWCSVFISNCEYKHRKSKKISSNKTFSLTTLCESILGGPAKLLLQISIFLTILSVVSFYLFSIGKSLLGNQDSFLIIKKKEGAFGNMNLFIFLAGIVAFLLSLINSVKLAYYSNLFGMFSVALCMVITIASGYMDKTTYAPVKFPVYNFDFKSVMNIFTDCIFLLAIILVVVENRQVIEDPDKNYNLTLGLSLSLSSVICFVYVFWSSYLFKGSINNKLYIEKSGLNTVIELIPMSYNILRVLANLGIALNLLFSVRLIMVSAISILEDILSGQLQRLNKHRRKAFSLGLRFLFVLVTVFVACLVGKIGVFVNLVGGIFMPLMSFGFPVVMNLKVMNFKLPFMDLLGSSVFILLMIITFISLLLMEN